MLFLYILYNFHAFMLARFLEFLLFFGILFMFSQFFDVFSWMGEKNIKTTSRLFETATKRRKTLKKIFGGKVFGDCSSYSASYWDGGSFRLKTFKIIDYIETSSSFSLRSLLVSWRKPLFSVQEVLNKTGGENLFMGILNHKWDFRINSIIFEILSVLLTFDIL